MFMPSTRYGDMSIKHNFLNIWSDSRKRPASNRPDMIRHLWFRAIPVCLSPLYTTRQKINLHLFGNRFTSHLYQIYSSPSGRLVQPKADIATIYFVSMYCV